MCPLHVRRVNFVLSVPLVVIRLSSPTLEGEEIPIYVVVLFRCKGPILLDDEKKPF